MKERNVIFSKRLIIFTALSIIIVTACLLTFFIGDKLGIWEIKPIAKETMQTAEDVQPLENLPKQEKINSDKKEEVITNSSIEEDAKSKPAVCEDTVVNEGKVVYLTFDDGSSKNTSEILKILKENNIKATFFFNTSDNQTSDSIIKEAYADGHAVGVLTSTDYNYDTIYSSVEDYLQDFQQSYDRLYQITGEQPGILRFPGGSINVFTKDNYSDLIEAIENRGLVYFDWNVCANDGSGNVSKELMVKNATKLPRKNEQCIVLMHDNGNDNSCEALKEIIHFYKDNGYDFQKLTVNVKPITF